MIIASAMTKLLDEKDCIEVKKGYCLCNQGFQFQIFLDRKKREKEAVKISGTLAEYITAYRVFDIKGKYGHPLNKTDEYYIKSEDDMYPDLLKKVDELNTTEQEKCVLLIDVCEREKPAGVHTVTIQIGTQTAEFTLEVFKGKLTEADIIFTNWFHLDGICHYYKVEPFSKEFYQHVSRFLDAYVKMGNNMILVPAFTPPLDTEVGGERLTTQLVKIQKRRSRYHFDFSGMKKYLDFCKEKGIKYFEHSHLFTQWGGAKCPKIMVEEDGKEYNAFGWDVDSTDIKYKRFLRQYLKALNGFLKQENLKDAFYLHLTDEPNIKHIKKYQALSRFIRRNARGLKTMDALSEKEFASAVDIPVVAMNSKELSLFDENKMLYYCTEVDNEYITNRYFHMPLQRTEILGFQLYENKAKGFLHWGYNFYNKQYSKGPVNPYEDTMAGGGFPAGDSFIVYPGEEQVNLSVRYFSIKRAFEDYRLLKTVEKKLGEEATFKMLHENGVQGVHIYPKSVKWHEEFRKKLMDCI